MLPRGGWTFAMVNLAGFTALTEWPGDEHAAELATGFADLAREHLGPGDRLVKSIGDAVLLASGEPQAAIGLVRELLEACYKLEGFPVARAGLHHGPAVERAGDMFGAAVNLTARLAGHASGGQVLGTRAVAEAASALGIATTSLGAPTLRNVAEPVEIWELDLCPRPTAAGIDPVCRMQVVHEAATGRLRHQGRDYWFCSLACAAAFAAEPDRFAANA